VHLDPAVVADEQSLEVVQPGEGALDDPADATESRPVLGLAAGDDRSDTPLTDEATVGVVVVAAIGDDGLGATAGPADATAYRRHLVQQRDQLGDVVAVAARDSPGQRDPGRVYQEVVLGAGSGSINRARARRGAPFFACT
jgi:hypothetical protein